MTDNVIAMFDAQAAGYEAQRRRLIPCYDAFYDAAVSALELIGRPPASVLDLGAGTGLLAGRVAIAYPNAAITLLDGARAMLAQAQQQLGSRGAYVQADLAGPLLEGPWDAVVSALAIHHLHDDGKRALFGRIHEGLAPGGVFVNAEQVAAPTPRLARAYAAWHASSSAAAGATAAEWAASLERMRLDRWATVADQLAWLRQAGFRDVDCLYKDHCFAVLVARRED